MCGQMLAHMPPIIGAPPSLSGGGDPGYPHDSTDSFVYRRQNQIIKNPVEEDYLVQENLEAAVLMNPMIKPQMDAN
eukprot:1368134-Amphidinium_carterae.1